MGCPIDWTHFNSWKAYTANKAGTGYRKNVYICREGTDWYDGSILRQDGLVIDRYCTATNYLEMGNVTAASLTLTISAPPNDISSWAVGQELEVQVDIFERTDPSDPEDGGAGTAFMGYFIIDSISERSGTYTIEALDRMILLDTPMDWTGLNPASITSVLSKIETDYSITIATDVTTLPNYTQSFADTPALTARQVLSAIAEVMGCCAYFDWNGELRFQWYEPVLDGSSNVVAITDEITFNSHTDPIQGIYELTDVGIGDPGDAKTETTPQAYYTEVKYNIIGNPLVESIRNSGGSVSGIATNIKNARYNISTPAEEIDFCNGEYEVLPFPYIWPLDTLQIDVTASYAPITHVTYRLNANMTLKSEVDPRVADYSSTFSNAQQTVINQMDAATEAINKHFFYANATGAHITTVENDPDSGNNVLIDSTGLYLRDNTDELASFTSDGATFDPSGHQKLRIVNSDVHGSQVMANADASGLADLTLVSDDKSKTVDGAECGMGLHMAEGVATLYSISRDTSGLSVYGQYQLEEEVLNATGDSTDGWDVTISDRLHVSGVYGQDAGSLLVDGDIKTPSKVKLVSSNNESYNGSYIQAVDGDSNGSVVLVRPGASLIAGGGEYASNRWGVGDISVTNEQAYLGADSAVYIESNGATIANRKTWTFFNGNITTPTGGLINGVDITTRGPKITDPTATTSNTSIASGTSWTNFTSFSLPAGTHIVEVVARFASNASGRRALNLSDSSGGSYYPYLFSQDNRAAVDGNYTFCHINTVIHVAAAKTLYINVAQNSGSALTTYVSYQYTKIGD